MRQYLFTYQTFVRFTNPVVNHHFRLRCQPMESESQRVEEDALVVSTHSWLQSGHDAFGNRTLVGCYLLPHLSFAFASSGIVSLTGEVCGHSSGNDSLFRYSTKLTTPTAELREVYVPDGSNRQKAEYICDYVHHLLSYRQEVTNSSTSVGEVMSIRQGVCQDFAHVMISLCRLNGIPARYVCGMMVGEGQTHAWVEVFDGRFWIGLDPTNAVAAGYGYVKLSHGRDASDCSVCKGVFGGNTCQDTMVSVSVFEI